MLQDIRGVLFYCCLLCLLVIVIQRGCNSRTDRWKDWRQNRWQQRQDRNDHHRDLKPDDEEEDDSHHWFDRFRFRS